MGSDDATARTSSVTEGVDQWTERAVAMGRSANPLLSESVRRWMGEPRIDGGESARVWLADSQRLLTHALAVCLDAQSDIEICGISTSLDAVAIRRADPDILVVSYFLLSTDHAGILDDLRAQLPRLRIVVLVVSQDDQTLSACVQVGAGGCLTRDQRPEDLIEAIRRAAKGEVLFPPDLLLRLLRRYGGERTGTAEPDTYRLAPRELEVLQGFAEGLGSAEIAARLVISMHTVRTHAKSSLAKLGAHTRAEAIAIAIKHGLIHPADR